MTTQTTRRNFLKGAGWLGVGAALIDPEKVLPSLIKDGTYELANFQDGKLKRGYGYISDWTLLFSSPNSFNPSGIKNLIVEIGSRKFELSHPKEIEVTETKKASLFYYEVKGNSWVEIND